MIDYKNKYIKYKNKYIKLKNQIGGNVYQFINLECFMGCMNGPNSSVQIVQLGNK